jgi:hypothetical protein
MWSLLTLLSAGRALADVRPPPGIFDNFAGLNALVGATLLTIVLILGGLWLSRKIHSQK